MTDAVGGAVMTDPPAAPAIKSVEASAFTVPTEQPERDGTLEWNQTTLLLVVARAGDSTGIGYSYSHPAAAEVVTARSPRSCASTIR